MAPIYTIFTAKAQIPFHYHFVCEHCGKDSGLLTAYVEGTDKVKTLGGGYKLMPKDEAELQANANDFAKVALDNRIADAELGLYGEGLQYKCPHCCKLQSWESRINWWKTLVYAGKGLLIGFFVWLIAIAAGVFGETFNLWALGAPIGLALGLVIGLIGVLRIKIHTLKTTKRNKPEFIWPNASTDISFNALIKLMMGQTMSCPKCSSIISYQFGAELAQKNGHSEKVMCSKCQSVYPLHYIPRKTNKVMPS